jgi:hypothetical protein
MADYGHPMELGYFLTPDASDPDGVLETARLADDLSLKSTVLRLGIGSTP